MGRPTLRPLRHSWPSWGPTPGSPKGPLRNNSVRKSRSRRPAGEARGGTYPSVRDRRATKPAGTIGREREDPSVHPVTRGRREAHRTKRPLEATIEEVVSRDVSLASLGDPGVRHGARVVDPESEGPRAPNARAPHHRCVPTLADHGSNRQHRLLHHGRLERSPQRRGWREVQADLDARAPGTRATRRGEVDHHAPAGGPGRAPQHRFDAPFGLRDDRGDDLNFWARHVAHHEAGHRSELPMLEARANERRRVEEPTFWAEARGREQLHPGQHRPAVERLPGRTEGKSAGRPHREGVGGGNLSEASPGGIGGAQLRLEHDIVVTPGELHPLGRARFLGPTYRVERRRGHRRRLDGDVAEDRPTLGDDALGSTPERQQTQRQPSQSHAQRLWHETRRASRLTRRSAEIRRRARGGGPRDQSDRSPGAPPAPGGKPLRSHSRGSARCRTRRGAYPGLQSTRALPA